MYGFIYLSLGALQRIISLEYFWYSIFLVMKWAIRIFFLVFVFLVQVSEDIHLWISEQYCEADQWSVSTFVDNFAGEG